MKTTIKLYGNFPRRTSSKTQLINLCSPQSGIERGTKHEHTWASDVDRTI